MEDALALGKEFDCKECNCYVLILVLMEDALAHIKIKQHEKVYQKS